MHIKGVNLVELYVKAYKMKALADFVKARRKEVCLTQAEFAERAGVALTVVRKIEQSKENLNLGAVNQVLKMFGHMLAPVSVREIGFDENKETKEED